MKYKLVWSKRFAKSYKLAQRRGCSIEKLDQIIRKLVNDEPLEKKNKDHDHPLYGNWLHHRECHIENDWLLIYYVYEDILVLELSRTGNHSDLFSK